MQWKKMILGAVLGGFIGFAGDFAVDFFIWHPASTSSEGPHTVCEWFFSPLKMGDSYESMDTFLIRRFGRIGAIRAEILVSSGVALMWLCQRGDFAIRVTTVSALLGSGSMVLVSNINAKNKVKKLASVSSQETSAA